MEELGPFIGEWAIEADFPAMAATGAGGRVTFEWALDARLLAVRLPQRFVGTFSDDGNSIAARWEIAKDHENWELDFGLRYTRVSGEGVS